MFSSKFIVKILLVLLIIGIIGGCAIFQDFLAPSDLVDSLETRDGVRIVGISVPDKNVKNNDEDTFSVYCTTKSRYDITNVVVNAQNIGKGFVSMVPNFAEPNKCSLTLTVSNNTKAGNTTLSITAYNNMGYTTTETFTITVEEINAYYVATNGNDTNIGATYAPFATIQYAIQQAKYEGVKKVYVSAGTYTNRSNGHCVELTNGVAIYGGYNYNDGYASQDTANNPTIIDGMNIAQHVVVGENIFDITAGIDGFVITGGNATNIDNESGGGIKLEGTSVFVKNCTIISNHSDMNGGGLCCVLYTGSIINNEFIANNAMSGGGAYFSHSVCAFIDNTITNNSADLGGGVYFSSCSPTIKNAVVINNTATFGGGMYLFGSSPMITNNIISNNSVSDSGGGMYLITYSSPDITGNTISSNCADNFGGGMYLLDHCEPTIANNTINHNRANKYNACYGGGMYIENSDPLITNNSIISNYAYSGGGIYLLCSSPNISKNTISYNIAFVEGGGGGTGGGLRMEFSSPILIGNTIQYNSATYGHGSAMLIGNSSPTNIQNLIIDNWNANSYLSIINIISGTEGQSYPVFISNIIGSTNGDTNHIGIREQGEVSNHTLQYNFFVSDALGFLYHDNGNGSTNNIIAVNNTNWTGALPGSTNNYMTNYNDALLLWDSYQ